MNFEEETNAPPRQKNFLPDGAENFPVRFGMVAVHLGFISAEELKMALIEQVEDDLAERRHRTIGIILYDRGLMTMAELHHTVSEMERRLKERERDSP